MVGTNGKSTAVFVQRLKTGLSFLKIEEGKLQEIKKNKMKNKSRKTRYSHLRWTISHRKIHS